MDTIQYMGIMAQGVGGYAGVGGSKGLGGGGYPGTDGA